MKKLIDEDVALMHIAAELDRAACGPTASA